MSKPTRLSKGFVNNRPSSRRQLESNYNYEYESDSESDEHVAHAAAASGNIPMLVRAVQNDPSILEEKDNDGLTPLTHAVNGKHLTAVKRLVKMGADVNVQDSQGRTYLSLAAYQGWYDGVVYLLRKGARQDISDRSGRTPLHAATYDKDSRCLNALLKRLSYDEINARDKELMTALHWSAFHGRPDHVRDLLLVGAELSVQDVDGKTPLHWAAQNGSRECCVLLAEHDMSILTRVDNSGKTPMHLAAAAGKPSIIKELANYHPDMSESEDHEERTPLHWATAMGHADCVKALLRLGVSPNPFDQDGMSPVQYAKNAGHKQCAMLLEESMRLKAFQTNKTHSRDTTQHKDKKRSGYFRGLFGGKSDKNNSNQKDNEQNSNRKRDRLPSLRVNGERKIVQGTNNDEYDAEISQLFNEDKVRESPKRNRNVGRDNIDLGTNGYVDDTGYTRTPDRSHLVKKKKKKRHHRDDRVSNRSSPSTMLTSSTWDEDRSTGNNSISARTANLSPLRGSVSPRIPQSPLSSRDMVPTPRRLGELVPIRPNSLSNNVPLHHNVSMLRDEHHGGLRSPTPPPVFKSISKKVLPDISPLTKNFNTIGLDSGITDPTYTNNL